MESKSKTMESKLETMTAMIAQQNILMEEQNSRNRVVLEGITSLWLRQERVEVRVDDVEKTLAAIARYRTERLP